MRFVGFLTLQALMLRQSGGVAPGSGKLQCGFFTFLLMQLIAKMIHRLIDNEIKHFAAALFEISSVITSLSLSAGGVDVMPVCCPLPSELEVRQMFCGTISLTD